MSEPNEDFKAGYKQGVEDGTAAFGDQHVFPGTHHRVHTPGCELWGKPLGVQIEQLLKERRKKLLTKKVTKWINIWETGPSVSDPASVRFGTGVLYDDKATAEANVIDPSRRDFLGTYPIELETEI